MYTSNVDVNVLNVARLYRLLLGGAILQTVFHSGIFRLKCWCSADVQNTRSKRPSLETSDLVFRQYTNLFIFRFVIKLLFGLTIGLRLTLY